MTGHLLKLLMKSHGLTPSLLAARANVRQSSLEAILSGTKEPNTREASHLARYFGLAVDDFTNLPTPALDSLPEWQSLRESLFQHGRRHGWKGVSEYLVVMVHAWGREVARYNMQSRQA